MDLILICVSFFFKYLLQIERHMRSLMSYYFSEKYGESQTAYLDENNYNNSRRNHKIISRLISTLQRAVNTTDYVYINYYRANYNNIPLWVLSNVLTFGNLSKMYKVFPQSLQSKVCKNFGCINRKQMEQFLSVLTKFRNVCLMVNVFLPIGQSTIYPIFHYTRKCRFPNRGSNTCMVKTICLPL